LENVSRGVLPPGKLYVKEFPTSQATVLDVESYLKTLEETTGNKLKVIVIDYINILANYRNPNSENTYLKIKQIAEDLRAMAVRNDWLIITATQINRSAWDSSEVTMQNIAESAGLAHTADMMYAIIQDSEMHAKREYFLKILKIRDGEGKGTKCRFEIDYEYMRLTETQDVFGS
jgi:replicative DNA helicase